VDQEDTRFGVMEVERHPRNVVVLFYPQNF